MKEEQNRAVLLALIDSLREKGSWCGETHIQKAAFFLKILTKVPINFDFILYKHGMFSFDLRDEISSLYSYGLADIEITYPYSPRVFVSSAGKNFMCFYHKKIDKYEKCINFITEKFSNRDVVDLEMLSIALHTKVRLCGPDPNVCSKKIVELKPHISFRQAYQAVHTIDQITKGGL